MGSRGARLPYDISIHGAQGDLLTDILHIFMLVLFVGWGIFIIYCLVRFRARAGHKAVYAPIKAKFANYIEWGVVFFEAAIFVFISEPVWRAYKNDRPDAAGALTVRVVAQQFQWNSHYAGPDGVFDKMDPYLVDEQSNPLGLPDDTDDITLQGQLHIPDDRPIIVELSSKDVIHSFSVPVLRVKQDAVPGMEIPIWFQVKKDSEALATLREQFQAEKSEVEGMRPEDMTALQFALSLQDVLAVENACAQLCGLSHFNMRGLVYIHTAETFETWLEEQSAEEEFMEEFDEEDDF